MRIKMKACLLVLYVATITTSVAGEPSLVSGAPISYPADETRTGVVELCVALDAAGKPQRVAVETSSGITRLDESARKAVEQWTFARPVNAARVVRLPVRFVRPIADADARIAAALGRHRQKDVVHAD